MKRFCIVLICFVFLGALFASSNRPVANVDQNTASSENLVIIGFQAIDSHSRNPLNLLERRDLNELFRSSDHFRLIMGNDVRNVMRAENITSTMERLSSDEARQIGEKLDASIVVWGTIVSTGGNNTQFRMSGTMVSMRTGNVANFSFVIGRSGNQDALRAGLYERLSEFSKTEMTQMFDMALQHYHNRSYEDAEALFQRVVSIDRENMDAYYYLGILNFEQNRFADAVREYSRGLDINPSDETLLLSIANAYRRQGLISQAVEALEKVAETRSDKNIYYNIALLYNERSFINEAMESLDKALNLDPEYEDAHSLYADIAYDNRYFEKAVEHLLFITDLRPDDEESARRLALSYQRLGQLDRAIERYQAIIASDSTNIRALVNLANAYRAIALENPDDATRLNRQALQAFVDALRVNPNNARVEISIADVHLALNDLANSERYANAALQKQADLHEASIILGSIAQRRGIERYNAYVELQTITDSGNLFGRDLDDTIARRDRTRAEAHTQFNLADRHFKNALEKTDIDRLKNDINNRIQGNQDFINRTRPDFFSE